MKQHPADLVLLDVFFPNESGLDILLKTKQLYPAVKVLMVTGLRQESVLEQAQKNGADGVLYKPFDTAELIAAIERVISK
jgi:DNA-binding NarL/FixJ family response regulator